MLDPFSACLGVLVSGPGSVEARYQPKGKDPLPRPVRVICSQADRLARFGGMQVAIGTQVVEIQRRDVSLPAEGDTIMIAGETLALVGQPIGDVEGLTWTCWLEQVA